MRNHTASLLTLRGPRWHIDMNLNEIMHVRISKNRGLASVKIPHNPEEALLRWADNKICRGAYARRSAKVAPYAIVLVPGFSQRNFLANKTR